LEFVKILIFITEDIFKHTAKKKKKKIKRADQILPEVYGTTLNKNIFQQIKKTAKEENQIKVEQTIQMYRDVPKVFGH
jgi:hypothetical protein